MEVPAEAGATKAGEQTDQQADRQGDKRGCSTVTIKQMKGTDRQAGKQAKQPGRQT